MGSHLTQQEKLQLSFLILITLVPLAVFFWVPSLQPIVLLTLLNVLLLSPVVRLLTSRRITKTSAILILYGVLAVFFVFGVSRLVQVLSTQWSGFIDSLPALGEGVMAKLEGLETHLRERLGFEINLGFRNSLAQAGIRARNWALTHLPSLAGSLASAALLVPIFSFFILKDGDSFGALYLELIPARFSVRAKEVLNKISISLGRFLRAKFIEALIFGLMTYLGLIALGSPYAGVFALIGGITNLIPYLGPAMGAGPPLLLFGLSESLQHLFWPAAIILTLANLIDNFLIFPVFVARIVNLTPLTLLVSVAIGQELFGVIGMLLAVPAASAIKIILTELKLLIYST